MTQKEMLQNAYLSDSKIKSLSINITDEDEADILSIVEQVIATVWYKL